MALSLEQVEHNRNMARALYGNSTFKKLLEDIEIEFVTRKMKLAIDEPDKAKRDEMCAEIRGARSVISHIKCRVLNSI